MWQQGRADIWNLRPDLEYDEVWNNIKSIVWDPVTSAQATKLQTQGEEGGQNEVIIFFSYLGAELVILDLFSQTMVKYSLVLMRFLFYLHM